MQRQTRLCIKLGPNSATVGQVERLVAAGVDAFLVPVADETSDSCVRWVANVREVERSSGQPLAVIVDLPGGRLDHDTVLDAIRPVSSAHIDFVAAATQHGAEGIRRIRQSLASQGDLEAQVLVRFDHANDFDDIDGIVRAADATMITEQGLMALDRWTAPVVQKTVARQCQIAAKPCIVSRNAAGSIADSSSARTADVFDLANIAFDHADGVVLQDGSASDQQLVDVVRAAGAILTTAEGYLEVTDRPVKVGFGQPPNAAILANAIRSILKMQEIAAVAVYSLTGATARVISKNWIDCPILAFSASQATARRMCLYHGVTSRLVPEPLDTAALLGTAGNLAKQLGIASTGDRIIVVSGHPHQTQHRANGFVVETVV